MRLVVCDMDGTLLDAAALSFAVGNAHPAVRARDTSPMNEEQGVVTDLAHLLPMG